jgi:hypothetical protein
VDPPPHDRFARASRPIRDFFWAGISQAKSEVALPVACIAAEVDGGRWRIELNGDHRFEIRSRERGAPASK